MQADILRLILLIVGLAVVLGIYLWDRRKRQNLRMREVREREEHRERPLGVTAGQTPGWSEDPDTLDIEHELQELDELLNEERDSRGSREAARAGASNQHHKGDLFGFRASSRAMPKEPPAPNLPSKILQINLVAKGAYFEGNDILRAANETGMEPGEMQIFHRFHQNSKGREALFSMASMVEPGIFPLDRMGDFSTPGLTLFAKLPGPMDGVAVFADMLFSAERMAAILDGELQDETHSALTKQTIEHIREEILEHRRHIQLLRKQH
jgi:cell division protein ZipA